MKDHTLEDRMESFFLAETTKYLYLLFDVNNDIIHKPKGKNLPPFLSMKLSTPPDLFIIMSICDFWISSEIQKIVEDRFFLKEVLKFWDLRFFFSKTSFQKMLTVRHLWSITIRSAYGNEILLTSCFHWFSGEIIKTPFGECVVESGGWIFNTEAHPIDAAALHCCSGTVIQNQ